MLKNPSFATAALLIFLLSATTGCTKSTHVTTSAAGHQVSADIEGNHSLETKPDQAVISSPFGTVTIERARVRFDDAPWTKIPERAPIKVRISKHKLRMTSGTVTVTRTIPMNRASNNVKSGASRSERQHQQPTTHN